MPMMLVSWQPFFVSLCRLSVQEPGLGSRLVMKSMPSKAWSCSSLVAGMDHCEKHYQQLKSESLTEEEMLRELGVLWIMFVLLFILDKC